MKITTEPIKKALIIKSSEILRSTPAIHNCTRKLN